MLIPSIVLLQFLQLIFIIKVFVTTICRHNQFKYAFIYLVEQFQLNYLGDFVFLRFSGVQFLQFKEIELFLDAVFFYDMFTVFHDF